MALFFVVFFSEFRCFFFFTFFPFCYPVYSMRNYLLKIKETHTQREIVAVAPVVRSKNYAKLKMSEITEMEKSWFFVTKQNKNSEASTFAVRSVSGSIVIFGKFK